MSQWPLKPLGELATLVGGGTPRRDNQLFWDGDICWVTPTDLPAADYGISQLHSTANKITPAGLEGSSAALLPEGTVLFSSRATIGKVAVATAPVSTNQGFANFIPGPSITSRFLAYSLWYRREAIARLSGSTTFKEVSRGTLRKVEIPVPSLAEQERIVRLLDEADAFRKLRAQADQRTAQLIPALFHEMFGDPATNPMGWPVRPLHALTESFGGGTPSRDKPSLWGGDIKWVTPTDLKAADEGVGLIFDTRDQITDEGLATSSARLLPTGTVLFSSRATIGKVAIATVPLATNQGFANFVPSSSVDSGYLATALWMVREDIASLSGSTTFKEVSRGVLRNYCLPVPPRNVQDAFAGYVADIRQLQSGQTVSRDRSDSLFQSMLYRAFAGEN